MNTKKILLGLATTVAFGLVAGQLLSLGNVALSPVIQSVGFGFVGTALGAFVARRGFLLPALGLWLLGWLGSIYMLYLIAEPTGQASIPAIVQYNLLGGFLSALAVSAGALFGQYLARRSEHAVAAT